MHVIIGGTGRLGSRVADRVAALGVRTVAAARASDWLPRVLDADPGGPRTLRRADLDLTSSGALDRLVDGAGCVVVTAHGRDARTRRQARAVELEAGRRVVRACERGGVGQLVHVSTWSAGSTSSVDTDRYRAEVEEQVRASRLPWTVLRLAPLMEAWSDLLCRELPAGRIPVAGAGRAEARWLAVDDAARAVAAVVGNPAALGQTLPVAGPEALSVAEVAHLLAGSLPVRPAVTAVPLPLLQAQAAALSRTRPLLARQLRTTLALERGDVPPPADDELRRAARLLPVARTTWLDLLHPLTANVD